VKKTRCTLSLSGKKDLFVEKNPSWIKEKQQEKNVFSFKKNVFFFFRVRVRSRYQCPTSVGSQ
jgi:hypothetical protein